MNQPKALYIQYTNPACYPPLEHSSKILADAGWQIVFLGTGADRGADKLRFLSYPQIRVKQMPYCTVRQLRKIHYLIYLIWVLIWTLGWRPRWVYASDPLVCPIAIWLKQLFKIKILYHEHDSPDESDRQLSWSAQFIRRARKLLGQRADLCILPNETRTQLFSKTTGRKDNLFTIWNCPLKKDAITPINFSKRDGLKVLYHGSIVPDRLPLSVIEALAILPERVMLLLIGYETVGHEGYLTQLLSKASDLRIEKRVQYHGLMQRQELLEFSRECDLGLVLMPNNTKNLNMQHMTGASCKAFDYLACGLPLLVSDLPEWKQMYVAPGYGLACNPDDPKSIAGAIQWYLSHLTEMKTMGAAGCRRIVNEWNYETEIAKIMTHINYCRSI
jgi:glycosyltransferase involved in cell wall biosynthesis